MAATAAQLGQVKTLIKMESTVLESDPEDLAPGKPLMVKIAGIRAAVLGTQKACRFLCFFLVGAKTGIFFRLTLVVAVMAKSGFINLEFSWGKWNGDDIRALEEPLLALAIRVCEWTTILHHRVHLF